MHDKNKLISIIDKFEQIEPILVLGDIGVDKYTKGEVTRVSPEAPVPIVEVYEEWTKLGLAANVSDNLQSLNVKNTICGVIGDDSHGNTLEDLVEEKGLRTWGIVRCEDRMTTFKERVVTNLQQVCRVDYETKTAMSGETVTRLIHRVSEFLENHSSLILQDYGKGLFNEEFSQKILAMAKEHNKFVAVDPSRITNPLLYRGANLLKPNQQESELMAKLLGYHETNISKIAEILVDKLELEKIIITLGAQGMLILDTKTNNTFKTIPTVAREVFDVSGAGDTAISAIVSSLMSGATLEEAAWIGNCASGVVVAKKGTALANQKELKEFLEKLDQIN
ncbi:MAG: D-glycero-beta-D-manno-heptose-7-phosphate kinase [Halobacteriovoraceae bacterium]|jgi:D-glycero-beta-D-manno-heptose-7-phosphate kinase|nr:D-glycero-beta-D-manno-heptose-7-phosphate kinase [Halobacteriovoraceae bacterium]